MKEADIEQAIITAIENGIESFLNGGQGYYDSLGDKKLPHVRALREQYQVLLAQKRKAYSAYKQAREVMKELYNVKSNVEHLLNISY